MSALRRPIDFSRRGACPALSAPMQTGDGLLVRLNPVAGGLSPDALVGLCEAALRHGNGIVEVTARGSLQLRGLTAQSAPLLAGEVDALGIAVNTGVPVQTGALAGLDPDEIADPTPLAERIRAAISAAGLDGKLGPKVSVVIDGGGRAGLDAVTADVRLTAQRHGADVCWQVAVAGDAGTATRLGSAREGEAFASTLAILQAIAAIGISARAKGLTVDGLALPVGLRRNHSTLPPSVLPDISPTRGEISSFGDWPISPPVGEMSGRTEGGAIKRQPTLLGVYPLADSRTALGLALPFGHLRAETLIAFAEEAIERGVSDIRFAPKRTLLALCPTRKAAQALRIEAKTRGFVVSDSDPRAQISACPGTPSCASGHIAARDLAHEFADRFGDLFDGVLDLHISGCAKGCAHPSEAALTVVGSENGAGLVVGGTARGEPLAYTADARQGLAGIARHLMAGRNAGADTATTLATLAEVEIARKVFGDR